MNRLLAAIFAIMLIIGGYLSYSREDTKLVNAGVSTDLPVCHVYISATTTTPQLPLWAAHKHGRIREVCDLDVSLWLNAEMLSSLLLEGNGDIWVGHIEGIARARKFGAPVSLIAVTGWRKFYLLSRDSTVSSIDDLANKQVAYSPRGSPAIPIVQALLSKDVFNSIKFAPYELNNLSFSILDGRLSTALLPEPFVTIVKARVPELKIVSNIEAEYGRRLNRQPRIPLAGIAVNTRTLSPEKISMLQRAICDEEKWLQENKEDVSGLLPSLLREYVSDSVLNDSMQRDMILAKPANEVAGEIKDYLAIVDAELLNGNLFEGDFLWPYTESKN